MKWKKSSPEMIKTLNRFLPTDDIIVHRKMFGYPCSFVNGNMFMGLFQDTLFIRLSESDREQFLRLKDTHHLEPIPGRKLKEYVVAPKWMFSKPNLLNKWIEQSLTYLLRLPPKTKKKPTKGKRKK